MAQSPAATFDQFSYLFADVLICPVNSCSYPPYPQSSVTSPDHPHVNGIFQYKPSFMYDNPHLLSTWVIYHPFGGPISGDPHVSTPGYTLGRRTASSEEVYSMARTKWLACGLVRKPGGNTTKDGNIRAISNHIHMCIHLFYTSIHFYLLIYSFLGRSVTRTGCDGGRVQIWNG